MFSAGLGISPHTADYLLLRISIHVLFKDWSQLIYTKYYSCADGIYQRQLALQTTAEGSWQNAYKL